MMTMADLIERLDRVANSTLYSQQMRELTGEAATYIRALTSSYEGLQAAMKEATIKIRDLRRALPEDNNE
jgi:hypothetical protein